MKKILIVIIIIFLTALTVSHAMEEEQFLIFEEGFTASWLTRIIIQEGRSNFVFRDFLPGLYFRTELQSENFLIPVIRIAVYYPLTSSFNMVPQFSANPLHIGGDITAGFTMQLLNFNYFRLNAGPALHILLLTSDRWNYFNLGGALSVGLEVPIAQDWTFLVNGFASLDNGNLGNNRYMEKFDIVYQYQFDIGVRYSKKLTNNTNIVSYIKTRTQQTDNDTSIIYR